VPIISSIAIKRKRLFIISSSFNSIIIIHHHIHISKWANSSPFIFPFHHSTNTSQSAALAASSEQLSPIPQSAHSSLAVHALIFLHILYSFLFLTSFGEGQFLLSARPKIAQTGGRKSRSKRAKTAAAVPLLKFTGHPLPNYFLRLTHISRTIRRRRQHFSPSKSKLINCLTL
jgi:hypothetical protein